MAEHTPPTAGTVAQLGWAYWLDDHWHLCTDEPVAHTRREPIVLRSALMAAYRRAESETARAEAAERELERERLLRPDTPSPPSAAPRLVYVLETDEPDAANIIGVYASLDLAIAASGNAPDKWKPGTDAVELCRWWYGPDGAISAHELGGLVAGSDDSTDTLIEAAKQVVATRLEDCRTCGARSYHSEDAVDALRAALASQPKGDVKR